jgi:hypothetical protein
VVIMHSYYGYRQKFFHRIKCKASTQLTQAKAFKI